MAVMMADVPVLARQISVPEPAEAWSALGFDTDAFAVGGIRIVPGAGELAVHADGLTTERPDGLPLHRLSDRASHTGLIRQTTHGNGARAVDHVVALTDSLARTTAALEGAGFERRRVTGPMAFFRFGPCILELVERGSAPALWGVVFVVDDLDGVPGTGEPRDAVQPGRRIATVSREAGLTTAVAFMTPRPQPGRPA
jgi:hypothetical protein